MKSAISIARTIPANFYTCSNHFQREVERIFLRNNWIHVGLVSQLKGVGDYFTGQIARQPFLVTKCSNDKEGLRAYDNVCRHKGTILARGNGRFDDGKVICCYHGWTYNLEGKLIKATRLKGIQDFKAKEYGLHPLPIKCLGDLLFLNFGDHTSEETFVDVNVDWEKLTFVKSKTYLLNCNWKVFVDNYLDGGYHVEYAHKKLASHLDLTTYKTSLYQRHNVQSVANKSNAADDRINRPATYTWIYPNLMLNRYGKWLDTNTVYPVSTDKCQVIFNWFVEKGGEDMTSNLDIAIDDSNEVQIEDEILCERVQDGMYSKFFTQGRYAPMVETAMYHFHDLLLKDLDMTSP